LTFTAKNEKKIDERNVGKNKKITTRGKTKFRGKNEKKL
jgi:hypothetical protein